MIRTIQNETARAVLYEDEYSRRIRVDDYSGQPETVLGLIQGVLPPWTEKLILKARPGDVDFFIHHDFSEEAMIAGYFSGTDMHFLTRYPTPARAISPKAKEEDQMIQRLLSAPPSSGPTPEVRVDFATPADAGALATLYGECFEVYPTPVNNPEHVRKTMGEGTVYVITRDNDRIISAASAEINETYRNAELTDCATRAGHEGKGLMRALLLELERHLHSRGIKCLYTIARSESFGMNKAFYQLGYKFGGRMTKNCMIYSGLEDMNVWYKFENSVI